MTGCPVPGAAPGRGPTARSVAGRAVGAVRLPRGGGRAGHGASEGWCRAVPVAAGGAGWVGGVGVVARPATLDRWGRTGFVVRRAGVAAPRVDGAGRGFLRSCRGRCLAEAE